VENDNHRYLDPPVCSGMSMQGEKLGYVNFCHWLPKLIVIIASSSEWSQND